MKKTVTNSEELAEAIAELAPCNLKIVTTDRTASKIKAVALCDAMMDAADARDRAARIVDAAMARRGAVAERPTETTPAGSPVQATENANRAPSKIPAGSKT